MFQFILSFIAVANIVIFCVYFVRQVAVRRWTCSGVFQISSCSCTPSGFILPSFSVLLAKVAILIFGRSILCCLRLGMKTYNLLEQFLQFVYGFSQCLFVVYVLYVYDFRNSLVQFPTRLRTISWSRCASQYLFCFCRFWRVLFWRPWHCGSAIPVCPCDSSHSDVHDPACRIHIMSVYKDLQCDVLFLFVVNEPRCGALHFVSNFAFFISWTFQVLLISSLMCFSVSRFSVLLHLSWSCFQFFALQFFISIFSFSDAVRLHSFGLPSFPIFHVLREKTQFTIRGWWQGGCLSFIYFDFPFLRFQMLFISVFRRCSSPIFELFTFSSSFSFLGFSLVLFTASVSSCVSFGFQVLPFSFLILSSSLISSVFSVLLALQFSERDSFSLDGRYLGFRSRASQCGRRWWARPAGTAVGLACRYYVFFILCLCNLLHSVNSLSRASSAHTDISVCSCC